MWIRAVDYLLAGVGLAGHALVLLLLFRRGLFARLPFFGILIGFYALRTVISFFLTPGSEDLGWSLAAMDPVLQCGVFVSMVLAWGFWSSRGHRIPALSILVGTLAFAALAAWYLGPSSHFSPRNLLLKAGIFVSVLWIEAALLTLISSRRMGGDFPGRVNRQIVFGFVVYSVVSLAADLGRYHLQAIGGMAWYLVLSYLPVAAYLVCLGVWIRACRQIPPLSRLSPGVA